MSSHAYVAGGKLTLAGELLDNESVSRFVHEIRARLFDAAGQVIRRIGLIAPVDAVYPRHRVPFFTTVTRPRSYDHYRLSVQLQPLPSTWPKPIPTTFLPGVPFTDSQGTHHFPGRLRNDGRTSILLPSVVYTLYGSRGQVLYANEAAVTPGTLQPKQVGSYDVQFDRTTGRNAVRKLARTR